MSVFWNNNRTLPDVVFDVFLSLFFFLPINLRYAIDFDNFVWHYISSIDYSDPYDTAVSLRWNLYDGICTILYFCRWNSYGINIYLLDPMIQSLGWMYCTVSCLCDIYLYFSDFIQSLWKVRKSSVQKRWNVVLRNNVDLFFCFFNNWLLKIIKSQTTWNVLWYTIDC